MAGRNHIEAWGTRARTVWRPFKIGQPGDSAAECQLGRPDLPVLAYLRAHRIDLRVA